MFHRVAFKWLTITVIVLVGFLVVLLFLGYLLKENEVKTTKLKAQLEQEAYQQQEKENQKHITFPDSRTTLSAIEKSQQKIIADNLNCQSNNQCFLVQTHSPRLGCIVAVNTTGTAILLKVSSQNKNKLSSDSRCQQEYENLPKISAQCRDSLCSF